jgi:hypothetical protein
VASCIGTEKREQRQVYRDRRTETGGRRQVYITEARGQRQVYRGKKAEDRRRETVVKGQEDSGQRTETG